LIGGKDGQAMVCDDSEEVAAAWNMGPAVVWHVNILNQKTANGVFGGWNKMVRWKRTLLYWRVILGTCFYTRILLCTRKEAIISTVQPILTHQIPLRAIDFFPYQHYHTIMPPLHLLCLLISLSTLFMPVLAAALFFSVLIFSNVSVFTPKKHFF
jgi:hypothetical protein